MIIDAQGHLVWFKQLTPPVTAANLQSAEYRGQTLLTWWEGKVRPWAYPTAERPLRVARTLADQINRGSVPQRHQELAAGYDLN